MAKSYPEGDPTVSPQAAGSGPYVLCPRAHSLDDLVWGARTFNYRVGDILDFLIIAPLRVPDFYHISDFEVTFTESLTSLRHRFLIYDLQRRDPSQQGAEPNVDNNRQIMLSLPSKHAAPSETHNAKRSAHIHGLHAGLRAYHGAWKFRSASW